MFTAFLMKDSSTPILSLQLMWDLVTFFSTGIPYIIIILVGYPLLIVVVFFFLCIIVHNFRNIYNIAVRFQFNDDSSAFLLF